MLYKHIIGLLNSIIPKRNNQIYLFSAFLYPDNIQAVYDAMRLYGVEKEYIVYCDGPGFAHYQNLGNRLVCHGSLSSVFKMLRSKYIVVDNGIYGLGHAGKDQILVNTWHGTSLKKIGRHLDGSESQSHPAATYAIAYSDFFVPVLSKAFGIEKSKVLVTGEPRNDYLYDHNCESILDELGISRSCNDRVLLWMPTYRRDPNGNAVDGMESDFGMPIVNRANIDSLDKACAEEHVILIIKWHGLQRAEDDIGGQFSNIFFLSSEDIARTSQPLYHLVATCDGLITDYSSVYVNYLVLNKPIFFAYDDMAEYEANRGFMFEDVKRIMPGAHINTMSALLSCIHDFAKGRDAYGDIRLDVCKKLNKYRDASNSRRLLMELGLIDG